MGVVKNIMVRAIADFSGLITGSRRAGDAMQSLSQRMNHYTGGMSGALTGVAGKLAALAGIYIGLEGLKTATADAIKFDAAMETLNNRLGQSAVGFNQWADTTGKAMGYSKTQIAEYGNTYSNMLYDAATDQADLAMKTQKFLETSAIVRSKTGLAQEEVSKRMRSAMNMEADGADELGINVRATAVEQSKAFKTMAGGVKNFSDLSSGIQKSIMYTYILDEVTRRYGNTVSGNAATQTAIFVASLKDLGLHLGQAFLPIWTTVLPALTNLVNWLDRTAQKVGVFMRVLFGYSAADTTKSAKDSTLAFKGQTSAVDGLTDAHKKLASAKAGVAGFDQVNTLPDKTDADDAAKAIGAPKTDGKATPESNARNQPVMDDIDSTSGAEGLANKVKKAFDDIKQAWKSVQDSFKEQNWIVIAIESIGGAIALYFGAAAIGALVTWGASFASMLILEAIPALYAFAVAQSVAFWEITLVVAVIAAVIAIIIVCIKYWDDIWKFMKKVGAWIGEFFGGLAAWFMDKVITPFIAGWDGAWSSFGKGVSDSWTAITTAFVGAAQWFYDKVIKPVVDFFVAMAVDVGNAAVAVWDAICAAFKTVGTWFKTNVIDVIVEKFGSMKTSVGEKATEAWTAIKNVFTEVETWFQTNVVAKVVSAFNNIKDGFAKGFKDGLVAVFNEVVGLLNTAIGAFNRVKNGTGVGKIIPDIPDIPRLAKGGITNGAMLAMIGDNAGGREVVSPLSDLQGHIATAVIQALQFSNNGSNQKSSDTRDIVLNIDGRAFARISKPYFDSESARVGGSNVTLSTV